MHLLRRVGQEVVSAPLVRLVRDLDRQGVTTRRNGGGHLVLSLRGAVVGILPGDLKERPGSALRKTLSQLRRAGLEVRP